MKKLAFLLFLVSSVLFADAADNVIKPKAPGGKVIVEAETSGFIPAGTILNYAGTSAPTGYLMCDGTCKSTSTYPVLSALLIAAGWPQSGCVAGEFKLPDLSGRFLRGVGGNSLVLGAPQDDATDSNNLTTVTKSISGTTNIGHSHTLPSTTVSGGTFASTGHTHDSGNQAALLDAGTHASWTGYDLLYKSALKSFVANYRYPVDMSGPEGVSYSVLGGVDVEGDTGTPSGTASSAPNIQHTHTLGTTNVALTNTAHNHSISSTDPETRPVNVAVSYIIKY